MENRILLKAGMKRHIGSLTGILLLMMMVSAITATVFTIWFNGKRYLEAELGQAGFGNMTAWVSDVPDMESLKESMEALDEVQKISQQNLIYTEYQVGNQESDSEGQLIPYGIEEQGYRFFQDDLKGYQEERPVIEPGQVYVSPSLISMMGVQIGDEIIFPIARNGVNRTLVVAGYYEDPIMGSSMIGMKGFLIAQEDSQTILETIAETGSNALARKGAMLHIFEQENREVTLTQLNQLLNEQTILPLYTEFVHTENAIGSFMLLLQNAFAGLLLAFGMVLLLVDMVVIGHSISGVIEREYANMGILKTLGMTWKQLARIQMIQYLIGIVLGIALGIGFSVPLSRLISHGLVTTTGFLTPSRLPVISSSIVFAGIIVLLLVFLIIRLRKIGQITPINSMHGEMEQLRWNSKDRSTIGREWLDFKLAVRQILTGKRRYVAASIVAVLLVFFASLAGRMDSWLGADGKGMMDAFNPADHDIGVQYLGELTNEQVEKIIHSYTDITDSYLLAMMGVNVSGINYTANVITEPQRFHIQQGQTSMSEDEVVLTESAASDLGVKIGDVFLVGGDKGSAEYRVSGIYQCANDMGKNIGMSREGYLRIGKDSPNIWCHHYFLSDTSQKEVITQMLETTYGGDVHVHENSWPGLLGIISAMQALLLFLYSMIIIFVLIVTVLTGSKILSAERKDMGIYKSLGFSTSRLRLTFALRFGLVSLIGSVVGIIIAVLLTDPLVATVMKLVGISNFVSHPSIGEVILPGVVVTVLFFCFAYIAAGKIKKMDIGILVVD